MFGYGRVPWQVYKDGGAFIWGGALIQGSSQGCFYLFCGPPSVISFDLVWSMDLICGFPSVVAHWIFYPFDQIVQPLRLPMTSVVEDLIHFVFFLSINDGGRWPREVRPMGVCFMIGA